MTRPVNLSLIAFRFPIAAIISILHRISGVVLFIGMGYLAYLLSMSLQSAESFAWVLHAMHHTAHGFFLWLVVSAVAYHFIAGIRHLLLDFHIGDSIEVSRGSAWAVLILSLVSSLLFGAWLVL
ncbi:MAG: succinate dehydrogenase, cytochrome b556 subunit [Gammaproteobacteria bacterium]|nr:succinate dehydrogenase, cytochrome b556 subunit [Gammaproteobacteria bacterium]